MTAALDKALSRVPIVKSAFLLGAIAPDLALWLLSTSTIAYCHWVLGWSPAESSRFVFDDLYFHNPFWIATHNTLHAPVLLLLGLSLVWRGRQNIGSYSRWLFWFLVACLLHSAIDILTHVDDGPLLFFPLEWTIRFRSFVSYWDPRYHGQAFHRFELGLDLGLLLYLLRSRVCRSILRTDARF